MTILPHIDQNKRQSKSDSYLSMTDFYGYVQLERKHIKVLRFTVDVSRLLDIFYLVLTGVFLFFLLSVWTTNWSETLMGDASTTTRYAKLTIATLE